MRWRVPICWARPGNVTSTAAASMAAASSAASRAALRAASASSTATRTSFTVLPTWARSSLATWPMLRRCAVSVPALPSTPMRTCSSAAVSAACAMRASVCSRSAATSSTIPMSSRFLSVSSPRRLRQTHIKKSLLSPWFAGDCSPIQGREKALAVPPRLTCRCCAPARSAAARDARPSGRPLVRSVTGAPVAPYCTSCRPAAAGWHPRSNALLGRESPRWSPGCFQPVAPVSDGNRAARRCLRHRM